MYLTHGLNVVYLHAGATDSGAVLASKWRRVSEAFPPLEKIYFGRRHAPSLTAGPKSAALPGSSPAEAAVSQQQQQQQQLRQPGQEANGDSSKDALDTFSEHLARFARNTQFQVGA